MNTGFASKLVLMTEAEGFREEIMQKMPPDVKARAASCIRKDKAFQIAAADWYMRRMAAEEGLGVADGIRIEHEDSGKPFLTSGGKRAGVHISISHCTGCLYLCMADSPIGCDVERIRRFPLNGGLGGFFSEEDLTAFRASEQPEALLIRVWTRREAFAKLTGMTEGLRKWTFHDREAAQKEHGISYTEGQKGEYLYTAVQYSMTDAGTDGERENN